MFEMGALKKTTFFALFLSLAGQLLLPAPSISNPLYLAPVPDAQYVSTGATIIIRYGPQLSRQNVDSLKFSVVGSQSGDHTGQTILADDHQTVIFKPNQPFAPGEKVSVSIGRLQFNLSTIYNPLSYSFTVSVKQGSGSPGSATKPPPSKPVETAFPKDLTLPQDIPQFTVSKGTANPGEGDIFVAPFYWTSDTVGSYLLILDNQGQIVYYQSVANSQNTFDFKVQPNGLLSYFSLKDNTEYLMNSHYQVVDKYTAGDGYTMDLHDFQLLPNGNALFMIYDAETIDMSRIVKNGSKNATVTGLIIQEMDPSHNVIFEWRSWDHFSMFDTTVSLTNQQIDLVHGNALAIANDGTLLLSSRNMSEITKINLQIGAIIWRLGGKANQFKFINDPQQQFSYQHDVRQLPNGDITIFDNHGDADPQNKVIAPSRAVEYKLDESKKTATLVWSFAHNPPLFGMYMGNVQRLADGNTFISWGAPYEGKGYAYSNITEVTPDNHTVWELSFVQQYVSYRAFRFQWHGTPTAPPALAFSEDANGLTLGYSWNGATDVTSWKLYGGSNSNSLNLVDQKNKTGFETQSYLAYIPTGLCYFQAAAIGKDGQELARSPVVSTDQTLCP
jgi:hypothetical protein